jgi:hypothetical protein
MHMSVLKLAGRASLAANLSPGMPIQAPVLCLHLQLTMLLEPLISLRRRRWIIMNLFHLTKSLLTHHPSVRIFQPIEATFSRLPSALLILVLLAGKMNKEEN